MRLIATYLGLAALAVAVWGAIGFATNAINLASLNFWGPKYEDARRNVVQHSLRRQEGVSEGIGALCLNMRLEKDLASKSAFATLIVQQATATGTQLTAEAESCKLEAQRQLGL
jgi:hypothetical protein